MSATDVIEKTEAKEEVEVKEPGKYKVVLHNDDKTTFDFVIFILTEVFNKSMKEAAEITMFVHEKGQAVAGIYTYQIAEMKIDESITLARRAGFPLTLTAEEL
jgi:ATP-dependent Clp protease adaptor protein ClpS